MFKTEALLDLRHLEFDSNESKLIIDNIINGRIFLMKDNCFIFILRGSFTESAMSDAGLVSRTHVFQLASSLGDACSSLVTRILPKHHSGVEMFLLVSPCDSISKYSEVHPASIGSISRGDWFSNDEHISGYLPCNNLLDSCPVEVPTSTDEQLIVGIVFGVTLVVELHIVEIYKISDCLMNGYVGTVLVELLLEVGALRSVGDCVRW